MEDWKRDAALDEYESWIQHRSREPREGDRVMVWQDGEWHGPGVITRNNDRNIWVTKVKMPMSPQGQDVLN